MSDTEADSFDLISVEIIHEESTVITVKVPKGHCGALLDVFQDKALGDQIADGLDLQRITNGALLEHASSRREHFRCTANDSKGGRHHPEICFGIIRAGAVEAAPLSLG